MAYTQHLSATDAEAEFTLSGEHLLLLKSNGGTWSLVILTPDTPAEEIPVTSFDGDTQQRVEVPTGTRLKLSGGTLGAKMWTGKIERAVGDFLN